MVSLAAMGIRALASLSGPAAALTHCLLRAAAVIVSARRHSPNHHRRSSLKRRLSLSQALPPQHSSTARCHRCLALTDEI
ncbi:uncharacterized protein A4U43_C06F15710 [Asparagus officinalis]|uniref:Secreted protein n=1 Tax=Asparagus officinalis TaxID=4686 RepID=A0A5P1ESR5_ASPOF|nr:uncharacterized protein A4U43_C06F15710 [Asparagus officinalis]